jgi:hypothetical protein
MLIFGFHHDLQAQGADPSLKLHLDFDESFSGARVLDVSGNGNDGWQFNPTNWITATNGVFGSTAAQFTYTGYISNCLTTPRQFSQYIALTNLNGFAVLTNGTISLWAKFDANGDIVMQLLDNGYSPGYTYDPSLATNSWSLGRVYTTYLCFMVYSPFGGQILVTWPDDVVRPGGFTPDLSTTSFHLYTVTIDCPNNRVVAYHDGQLYMTGTIGVPWIRIYGCYSQRWLCVGAASHDGSPQWGDDCYPNDGFFAGKMDDLRIYNRTLSALEVQQLYQGSTYAQSLRIQKASQSVQLCWPTSSNATYQVEYQSELLSTPWTSLGLPIAGDGQSNCFSDSTPGVTSRFYRVRVLPQ